MVTRSSAQVRPGASQWSELTAAGARRDQSMGTNGDQSAAPTARHNGPESAAQLPPGTVSGIRGERAAGRHPDRMGHTAGRAVPHSESSTPIQTGRIPMFSKASGVVRTVTC